MFIAIHGSTAFMLLSYCSYNRARLLLLANVLHGSAIRADHNNPVVR